jgi:glycosyltransferase involved in cell wall biosynthesis
VNPCLLIPIYNHPDTIGEVVSGLESLRLPCLIVDDGSDRATRAVLADLDAKHEWVRVVHRDENGGRGAALRTGYQRAAELGHSHAIQLDADGQHATADLPGVIDAVRRRPEALVLGAPHFDESAPTSRRYGRLISKLWVWIETCSGEIHDPLCGLRGIPLEATIRVFDRVACGDRMDFDPEIAVRLVWAGTPVVNVPVGVRYFADGVSHFDLWRDNLRISWLHTRLFAGMLLRLPGLVARRFRSAA